MKWDKKKWKFVTIDGFEECALGNKAPRLFRGRWAACQRSSVMRSASTTISHFCSLQEGNFIPPEQRKLRRIHGLQLPLHPQQVVGWIALIIIGCGTIGVLIPLLNPQLQAPVLCLIIPSFFVHFVSHLVALLIDPAEPQVRAQPTSQVVPEFDRTKHLHVIENGRYDLLLIHFL